MRVIGLLGQSRALHDAIGGQKRVEVAIQLVDGRLLQPMSCADDHSVLHRTVVMKVVIESHNLLESFLQTVGDLEKAKVRRRDQALVEQIVDDKPPPCLPIAAIWPVQQNHRDDRAFSGLHESEHLAAFVVGAKSSREQYERVCLLYKM